jgi:hypothetical protein
MSARAADVGEALEKAATFDPTLHFGKVGAIELEPMLQARWTGVEAANVTNESVVGFSVPRARLAVTTTLFDVVSFRLRVGSSSNGSAIFQQAYAEAHWKAFRVCAGQFDLKLNEGEVPSAQDLSSADFSSYANTFAGGETQGISFRYDGPLRVTATLGNGARSGFSELLSPLVADLATTVNMEIPLGSRRVQPHGSQASFRRGQKTTGRIAVIGHFQTKGTTASAPSNDVVIGSADAALRGSGFSLLASVSYMAIAESGSPTAETAGVMLLASVFAARRVELWGQFDAIYPLGSRAPFPPGVASGQPGTTLFRTLTVGSNFYIVPDCHRLKIQVDLQTMFDGEKTSLIPPNPALGVLSASGAQVAARVQLVASL